MNICVVSNGFVKMISVACHGVYLPWALECPSCRFYTNSAVFYHEEISISDLSVSIKFI